MPKNMIRINTLIVVQTTIALLIIGWISFFILEYNNTLAEHKTIGAKLAVSFFNSVTPRTAGFNNIDMSLMLNPTVLIFILLMWIGASPGSTGGGIKTTTIAVAILNLRNQVMGKDRLEFRRKEIPIQATQRSNVIIFLSLLAIGFAVFLLSLFDPKVDVLKLAFETFSAFCTVGLTLGITPQLSDASKVVLIIMMFLGRVSLLTFIIAIMRQFYEPRGARYQYPKEDIFIN
jgi:Trk-type K+ transport system membrane component